MSENANQELFAAIGDGNLEAIRAALERGASLEAVNEFYMTPLTLAARDGQVEIVAYLLDRGAEVSHDTVYVASQSVSCPPSLLKFLQLAQMMQVQPATDYVSVQDAELLNAAYAGDLAASARALGAGADPNASDGQDTSALRWAARHRHCAVVEGLLAAGADVNRQSAAGWTALMEAVIAGDRELVELLIDRGAELNATTLAGASALYFALEMTQLSPDPERASAIYRMLQERGAEYLSPGDEDD